MKKLFRIGIVISLFLFLLITCKKDTAVNYVKIERPLRDRPMLRTLLNGKPATFLLDTGATLSIIDSNQLRRYGIPFDNISLGNFVGVGGGTPFYILKDQPTFQLGNHNYDILFTTINMGDIVLGAETFSEVHLVGLLGCDFLGKYGGIIDFTTNTLILTKQ